MNAHVHWKMFHDLQDALEKHPEVWNQSRTFWYLTLNAHNVTIIELLCRVFDQEKNSLHLLSWLKTIQSNICIFDTTEFKLRLAGNPFVDSLAEESRSPNLATLENDINICSIADPLVNKLITQRHNFVAHTSAKLAAKNKRLPTDFDLSEEELKILLDRALTILNRYCQLFAAESYSVNMIGKDDFKFIFSSIKSAVELSRKK